MKIKTLLCLLLIFSAVCVKAQKDAEYKRQFDLGYFLQHFYDVSSLPQYVSSTYDAEVSTYDRTGGNDDGFSGTYSFIRRNADSSLVVFDQRGPGVINRIWTPTPTEDTLDFYIDDTAKPAFSLYYKDLFSGKIYPFVSPLCANQLGGYYCYLPIPFNKHCKIVSRGKLMMFHQVGYRLYPKEYLVKSFSMQLDEKEKAALQKIKTTWSKKNLTIKDIYQTSGSINSIKQLITLSPGRTATVFKTQAGGRIAGFEITSQSALNEIAKNIDLKITWDDEAAPAVYCPLADYFGYAFGKPSMNGLMAGTDGKRHYSWFPMPFDKSATVELIYRKNKDQDELSAVSLLSTFYVENKKRNPATEGKFYAAWNRQNPVPNGKAYPMLDAKGKGHFVGVALQSQGLIAGITGFFEGDDSTVIDGELRYHGTGSEDFFNGGWYALLDRWDGGTSLPLSGCLAYSLPLAHTGGYRFFLSDKMAFNKSIFQSIEHAPDHNSWPADYTSVAYYYCDRNNAQSIQPNNQNTEITYLDTLEIYPQLTMTTMDERLDAIARWEGHAAKAVFFTVSDETVLKYSLDEIPNGDYDVLIEYQKQPNGAAFSLWQRQTQVADWTNTYAATKQDFAIEKKTSISVTHQSRSLSFRFKTAAEKNQFTLRRIILVKKK